MCHSYKIDLFLYFLLSFALHCYPDWCDMLRNTDWCDMLCFEFSVSDISIVVFILLLWVRSHLSFCLNNSSFANWMQTRTWLGSLTCKSYCILKATFRRGGRLLSTDWTRLTIKKRNHSFILHSFKLHLYSIHFQVFIESSSV